MCVRVCVCVWVGVCHKLNDFVPLDHSFSMSGTSVLLGTNLRHENITFGKPGSTLVSKTTCIMCAQS